jgi:hypothetical protein
LSWKPRAFIRNNRTRLLGGTPISMKIIPNLFKNLQQEGGGKTMKIGLVACSARKLNEPAPAEKLYSKSALFRYAVSYSKKIYDSTYVLSARFGLMPLTKTVEPYETSLTTISKEEFDAWLKMVAEQIKTTFPKEAELYFHTGAKHCLLIPFLTEYKVFTPMKSMPIGKRLKWYKEQLAS